MDGQGPPYLSARRGAAARVQRPERGPERAGAGETARRGDRGAGTESRAGSAAVAGGSAAPRAFKGALAFLGAARANGERAGRKREGGASGLLSPPRAAGRSAFQRGHEGGLGHSSRVTSQEMWGSPTRPGARGLSALALAAREPVASGGGPPSRHGALANHARPQGGRSDELVSLMNARFGGAHSEPEPVSKRKNYRKKEKRAA